MVFETPWRLSSHGDKKRILKSFHLNSFQQCDVLLPRNEVRCSGLCGFQGFWKHHITFALQLQRFMLIQQINID